MARKISKKTPTWFMFEKLMMWRQPEDGPIVLDNMTRGKAINLCQGLNCCQSAYQVEQGRPDSATFFSAKAKANADGTWFVEISENHTKQGTKNTSPAWLTELLNSPEIAKHTTGRHEIAGEVPANAPTEESGTFFAPGDPRAANPDEEWMEKIIFGEGK